MAEFLKGFEMFKDVGRKDAMQISISPKSGRIAFNEAAVREFKLSDMNLAYLFFNKVTNQIAIKLCKEASERGALKAQFRKSSGFYLSAARFLEKFGIFMAEPTFFDIETMPGHANVFVISLNKPTKRTRTSKK